MASAVLVTCLIIAAAGVRSAEGIRRHHRHRRDPDPVGEERVQKPNLYKPKFEDCETYEPAVEEGSRKGKDLRRIGNLWVIAADNFTRSLLYLFKVFLRVTQHRGSHFCCATT